MDGRTDFTLAALPSTTRGLAALPRLRLHTLIPRSTRFGDLLFYFCFGLFFNNTLHIISTIHASAWNYPHATDGRPVTTWQGFTGSEKWRLGRDGCSHRFVSFRLARGLAPRSFQHDLYPVGRRRTDTHPFGEEEGHADGFSDYIGRRIIWVNVQRLLLYGVSTTFSPHLAHGPYRPCWVLHKSTKLRDVAL